jgi:hypothetical protein
LGGSLSPSWLEPEHWACMGMPPSPRVQIKTGDVWAWKVLHVPVEGYFVRLMINGILRLSREREKGGCSNSSARVVSILKAVD